MATALLPRQATSTTERVSMAVPWGAGGQRATLTLDDSQWTQQGTTVQLVAEVSFDNGATWRYGGGSEIPQGSKAIKGSGPPSISVGPMKFADEGVRALGVDRLAMRVDNPGLIRVKLRRGPGGSQNPVVGVIFGFDFDRRVP